MGRGTTFKHDPEPDAACWGIRCPYCGTDKHEVERTLVGHSCIVRERHCFNEHVFYTQEELGQQSKFLQAVRRIKRKRNMR